MNPKICVICRNSKPVNQTDNRLVTEDCGHVKCMGCLLLEKSGCVACLREGSDQESGEGQTEPKELSKKKKPETSHVRIVTGSEMKSIIILLIYVGFKEKYFFRH